MALYALVVVKNICLRLRISDTRQKIMSCNRLLKTGCNNIVGATLFLVVNNIEQYC